MAVSIQMRTEEARRRTNSLEVAIDSLSIPDGSFTAPHSHWIPSTADAWGQWAGVGPVCFTSEANLLEKKAGRRDPSVW